MDTCRAKRKVLITKSLYPDKGLIFDLLDDVFCAGTPHDTTTMRNSQRNHVTRAGADSCKGDSGGPLVCDIDGSLTLIGIVSKGRMCNKEGFPGIYTNVQAFRTWLDESKFERISSLDKSALAVKRCELRSNLACIDKLRATLLAYFFPV